LRAINGTLRAAAPIGCRSARVRDSRCTWPANDWKDCHATPRRGTAVRADDEPSRDADAVSNLDRSKSRVKRRLPAAIRLFLCTASPRRTWHARPADCAAAVERRSGLSADSDTPHVMSDSDFSARRLAARYR